MEKRIRNLSFCASSYNFDNFYNKMNVWKNRKKEIFFDKPKKLHLDKKEQRKNITWQINIPEKFKNHLKVEYKNILILNKINPCFKKKKTDRF